VYFQQKPNIYENAKAFLRFTPGKLHSQQLQSDINVNGCQAKKQKKKERQEKPNPTQTETKLAATAGGCQKTEHELRFKH